MHSAAEIIEQRSLKLLWSKYKDCRTATCVTVLQPSYVMPCPPLSGRSGFADTIYLMKEII